MNYKILITLSIWFTLTNAYSQSHYRLSLAEATKLALENSENLKNLQLDYQIQEHKNKEIVGTALPQISLSGGITYYTNLPTIQFPTSDIATYNVLAKEGVRDGSGQPIDPANATFGKQLVSFQAPFNAQYGIGINQLLFQPDVFVAYQAREKVLEFKAANNSVAEVQAKEAVHKAYYAVLIAQKQKEVLSGTIERLTKIEREMNEMLKAGFIEKLDVDKLIVSINNTRTAVNQLDNAIAISNAIFKNTIGLSEQDSIVLTESLNIDNIKGLAINNFGDINYEDRKEIQLLDIGRQLQSLEMRRHKLGIYPTVAAFFNFQRSGQRNEAFAFPGESPWFWFNTGLIGLNINQPIFDGGQRKHRLSGSKLEMQKIENNIKMVKEAINMEYTIAKSSLGNALLNIDVQNRNIDLAKSVFENTKTKYQAGVGSSFELLQAETELQRAQGSYHQALYEGYIAKINLEKALGKL